MNEEIVMHLSSAADRWERTHPIIGFGELRVHDALRDAVRCIKETSAQVPRWISVEERLPEKRGTYLCNYEFEESGRIVMSCDYLGSERWSFMQSSITHWMQLPEPPKEEIK